MYGLREKERECLSEDYGKLDDVFSKDGAFMFACALSGMGIFVFLRTLVSMFGMIRFEEFYAAYSLIGYGAMTTGLINFFFGGIETFLLCFISVSIFSMISAVKHEDREKIGKYSKWLKRLLVALWFLILFMVALSATSAWFLDDAYRQIKKFNDSVEYSARGLFINTIIFGFIAFTVQDVFMNMMLNLEDTVHGRFLRKGERFWEIAIILAGCLFIMGELVLSIVAIIGFDYREIQEVPEKFALFLINVLIYAITAVTLIFFIKMFVDYLIAVRMGEEEKSEYFYEDYFEEEKFESRVFGNEPVNFGSAEGYQLTFEIPHTEYPDRTERESETDG